MPLSPGTRLGPYEILSPIGAGGMGEVWKARDPRLDRTVAIKQLKADDPARFESEARAIAAMNHPHICQIYDVGPDYLVMEFIDGAPIRGPLPADEAVRLAIQIAGALEEAHGRGILHRDLKPANILVTPKGAKLLDFGIAKFTAADATQTIEGYVTGTPAYMAPEQVDGSPADPRSDIFSFGAVLYEMLSGNRAFSGLSSVLRDDPPTLAAPPALYRIVARCLRKAPADRFQTMADLRAALEGQPIASLSSPSIAVLAFDNLSADKENEYFSDGLAEEIINALAHVAGLKVIARTSAFAFKGQHQDIRRIAAALDVANVLEGSVRRAGNRIRVTAQLITAADGSHLWSERYDREMSDVFAIQDEIAQAIAAALKVKLALTPRHVPELPAYEALLRGRYYRGKFTPDAHKRAQESFEHCIALDPAYAAPHVEVSLNYLFFATNGVRTMREVAPLIRAEAQRALEIEPTETDPHYLLASVAACHDYDWPQAARHFQIALSSPSASADARWAYASFYLQPMGRQREAVAELRRAVAQDPLNVAWRAILGSHLNAAERYDEAREELLKALDIDSSHWIAMCVLAQVAIATGKFTEALSWAEKAYAANPMHTMNVGVLAALLTRAGETDRASALLREMGDAPNPVWGRVEYHLICGEIDEAANWYEKMIETREPFAVVFAAYQVCKGLRQSRRWPRLAKLMNLSETLA